MGWQTRGAGLRIFYAAADSPHQDLPGSKLWRANLHDTLVDLGHDVVEFAFDYRGISLNLDGTVASQAEYINRHRPRNSEILLQQVAAAHKVRPLDVFFSYFSTAHVEPAVIRDIGRMGIVTVNWYCNGSYQFNLVEAIAPAYDYCLVPEKFRMADYRRIGANPIYCQEAANPNVYRPCTVPVEYDVTFVGQKYGTRPIYIRQLVDHGIDVRVWGPLWQEGFSLRRLRGKLGEARRRFRAGHRPFYRRDVPRERCGPPLEDEELIRMYSRSRVSLGFSAVAAVPLGQEPIKQVRLRDFEAPMSGAFYLVEYFEELMEFFEPDKEIVCFSDADELVDKARYYLKHDAERERIRNAGHVRCRREHTWHKRFEAAFREMGLS